MNTRKTLSLVLFALLLIPGISAPTPAPADKEKPKRKTAEADNPFTTLKQGMAAEELKKVLGEPVETKPMKAPNGKAEVWIYVREVSRRVDQVRVTTPDSVYETREADGSVRRHVTLGSEQIQDVHYLTEDVAEVLMFNDHYVVHKVTRMERKL